jgi:hypothetical protein
VRVLQIKPVPPTLGDSSLQLRNSQVRPVGPVLDLAQLVEEIQALCSENNRLQILSAKHADEICSLKCQQQDSTAGSEGVNVSSGILCDLLDQVASIISTLTGQPSPSKTARFMADDISWSPIGSYIHNIIKLSIGKGKFVALADITPHMCRDALDKPSLYKRLPPAIVLGEVGLVSFIDSGDASVRDSALSKDDWRDACLNLLFIVCGLKVYDEYLQNQLSNLFDILIKSKYFVLQFPIVARTCYKAC